MVILSVLPVTGIALRKPKILWKRETEDEKGKKEMEKNYIKFHNDNNIMRQLWNFISDSNEQL